MEDFIELRNSLRALIVLRGVLDDPVMARFCALLDTLSGPQPEMIDAYASFASALLEETEDFSEYLLGLAQQDVNAYVLRCAKGLPPGDILEQSLQSDLAALQAVSRLDAARVKSRVGYAGYLPEWRTRDIDFLSAHRARMEEIPARGYGIFAKHHMFSVDGGDIVPVRTPDPVRLSDLYGYERQRSAVVRNTLSLLSGRPAADALLYGDAGTGKSSTVKALVNEYRGRGLRLVEVRKNQLSGLPAVMETLGALPLKFIVFIDDLSFAAEGDDYYAVKAVLEGSAAAKAGNTVVYATSNRRHLVKELFSDRAGDDVNVGETIQEMCSLSDRFGLTVGFFKPDREQYIDIVRALAAQHGLRTSGKALEEEAERFALGSGRSPRAAQQLIVRLIGMEEETR
jgi:hypothetical protein